MKNIISFLSILIGIIVSLNGCKKFPQRDDNCTGNCLTFGGIVVDSITNNALSDVQVTLHPVDGIFVKVGVETYTDENGYYKFSIADSIFMEAGKGQLSYVKQDYMVNRSTFSYEELVYLNEDLGETPLSQAGTLTIQTSVINKKVKRIRIEIEEASFPNIKYFHLSDKDLPVTNSFSKIIPADIPVWVNIETSNNKNGTFGDNWKSITGYPQTVVIEHQETITLEEVID
ncbi:MAG: hypothetical protein AB8B72_03820 [Crocinitomicaceae bacterium]